MSRVSLQRFEIAKKIKISDTYCFNIYNQKSNH